MLTEIIAPQSNEHIWIGVISSDTSPEFQDPWHLSYSIPGFMSIDRQFSLCIYRYHNTTLDMRPIFDLLTRGDGPRKPVIGVVRNLYSISPVERHRIRVIHTHTGLIRYGASSILDDVIPWLPSGLNCHIMGTATVPDENHCLTSMTICSLGQSDMRQETRRPLRAVVEGGLRLVLSKDTRPEHYTLPDFSYGGPEIHDHLASYTWPELRDIIYGDGPGS